MVASQKLHRASGWPCKASRLTWASEPGGVVTPVSRVAKLGVGSSGGPPSHRLFDDNS